jgi:hypothetical protein
VKSSTKTVGGSPTSGLGQDFNKFLQGGLSSGNFGSNAAAQTQGMGGAINSLLGGQIGDPSTLQGFLQGLQGNGGVGNLPNVNGNFNSPQFQGLDFSSLGQVGTQGPNIGMGGQNAGLNTQGIGGAQNLPGINFNPSQFQNTQMQGTLGSAAGLDPNGSFSQALQQIAQQGLDKGVADTRERFTGQSGTPAGFAEAALRAQLQPQLISQLSQANQQERGLNLQQLGQNQNALGQLNSQNLQQGLAANQFNQQNSQLGLNAQGINTQNILQNQGLQNQGGLGLNANLLSQLGLGNDATNAFNQSNLQSFGQQQQGQQMNTQNLLQQMQQMLGQSQNQNIFNQGNSQFGASLGQQGQQLNAQNMLGNQQNMNQFGLGQANVGMQNQQQQLQAILGALGPLFSGLQQGTGMATPQAQTVQNPSMFSQIVGGLTSLGGMAAPFMTGGLSSLFGGGAPNVMMGGTPQQSLPNSMINFTPSNLGGLNNFNPVIR